MKKLFAIILSGLIICSFAACGQNNASSQSSTEAATTAAEAETSASEGGDVIAGGITDAESPVEPDEVNPIAGGYTEPETPEVTPEAQKALTKALEGLDGAQYEAKALLGTQIVSGTNYMLLCKITPVTANPQPHYSIVTVYEDLEGNASISDTHDFNAADDAAATAEAQSETSNG